MKNKKSKKGAKIALKTIIGILLVIVIVAGVMFGKLGYSLTVGTNKLADGVYHIDYKENYKLDELLEQGGASTEDELVSYIIKVMLKGLPVNIEYSVPELACSTFCAASPEDEKIFCRNFDNDPMDFAVVNTNPKNGYSSVSVVSLSFLGYNDEKKPDKLANRIEILATPYFPLDGVNEKGLAVGVLQLTAEATNQNTEKPDVDTTLAIRMLLDKCATVDEAVSMLGEYDMHASAGGCYHLQIADAEGNSAVVTWVEDEMVVIPKEGKFQCATNFFLCDTPFEAPRYGEDRYDKMCEVLGANDGIRTETEAKELLQTVSADGNNIANAYTQWSSVYNLTKGTLSIYADRDYDTPYTFSATK